MGSQNGFDHHGHFGIPIPPVPTKPLGLSGFAGRQVTTLALPHVSLPVRSAEEAGGSTWLRESGALKGQTRKLF